MYLMLNIFVCCKNRKIGENLMNEYILYDMILVN